MITMDEGVKIPEEDINDKVSLLRASLSTGELPDDLKNLISALEKVKKKLLNLQKILILVKM